MCVCVSCFPCISRLTSLDLRMICTFFQCLTIKSGACSCQDADQRLGCHRAVLFSHQCSQTSAGVWHRARQQRHPEADDGGALAREVGDMWDNPCLSLPFLFCGPPTSEESAPDGAEQAAAPGGGARRCRSVLAKRRGGIRELLLQDAHFSQFPGHSSPSCISLCRRTSRRSLSCSFTHFHCSRR